MSLITIYQPQGPLLLQKYLLWMQVHLADNFSALLHLLPQHIQLLWYGTFSLVKDLNACTTECFVLSTRSVDSDGNPATKSLLFWDL